MSFQLRPHRNRIVKGMFGFALTLVFTCPATSATNSPALVVVKNSPSKAAPAPPELPVTAKEAGNTAESVAALEGEQAEPEEPEGDVTPSEPKEDQPESAETASDTPTAAMNIQPLPFRDNGNGTLNDSRSGLLWQQRDEDAERTWEQATAYCQALNLVGGGWRLPNKEELTGILEQDSQEMIRLNPAAFPAAHDWYWSASTHGDINAYFVDFNNAYVSWTSKEVLLHVRCVRLAAQ